MYIANIRVTHKTAPHNVISQMALTESDKRNLYEAFLAKENISEVIIIQTCNRFEIFFVGIGENEGKAQARKVILDRFGAHIAKYMIVDTYLESIAHLFRVAASIDSMVIGENQILTQMKESLTYASKNHYSGKILEMTFQKALSVGKNVRAKTHISDGKISISSVSVDLANQHNSLKDKKIVIVGTGNMASLIAEYLPLFHHGELVVLGRTPEKLKKFCETYSGRPFSLDHLTTELSDADVVFSATSCPHVLITREIVEKAVRGRSQPLVIVDIAMPQDVDPTVGEIPNVTYFCIDDLQEVSKKNKTKRDKEAKKALTIIDEEIERFRKRLQESHIDHLLYHLNTYAEDIRQREVKKSMSMLRNADPKAQTVMDGLSKSLMKKVLHNFILSIKSSNVTAEEVESLINLFTTNNGKNNSDELKKKD